MVEQEGAEAEADFGEEGCEVRGRGEGEERDGVEACQEGVNG